MDLSMGLRVDLTKVQETLNKNEFSVKTCLKLGSVETTTAEAKFITSAYLKLRKDLIDNWPYIVIALVLFVLVVAIIVVVMKRMKVTKELAANREELLDTKRQQRESRINLRKSQAALKNFDPNRLGEVLRQMSAEREQQQSTITEK